MTTTMLAGALFAPPEPLAVLGVDAVSEAARAATVAQNLAGATRLEAAHALVEQFAADERSRDEDDRAAGRSPRPAYARLDPQGRARDHLCAALALTTWHAARLVIAGVQIHTRLPRLRKAVARGLFPEQLAIDTACRLAEVGDEVIGSVEAEVVTCLARDLAGGHRPSRTALDSLVDEAIERRDPAAAGEAAAAAAETRTVRFRPDRNGMARLWARLPATEAELLRRRIDADARAAAAADAAAGVAGVARAPRPLAQLRADALAALATAADADAAPGATTTTVVDDAGEEFDVVAPIPVEEAPRPNLGDAAAGSGQPIRITVIAAAARGLPNRVEFVHGAYCSFDWLCRQLLEGGEASVRYETIDPAPGALDSPEYALRYLLTPQMVERIRLRDGTCRHPGCTVPARDCDIDHVIAFDTTYPELGGPTTEWNLMCLCRTHHREKTFGSNAYRPGPLGELTIITGDGTEHRTRPTGPLARARDQIRHHAWNTHIDRLLTQDGHLTNPPGTHRHHPA